MSLTMHASSAPAFLRVLNNMLAWLDKAQAYAEVRKSDANNYLGMRLAPVAPLAGMLAVAGLLRSLLVAAPCRGAGLGRRLVAALEASASERKVRELWLLTIDAEHFFARLAYNATARAAAPAAIQASAEFASLCPASAVLMRKSLA